MTCFQCGKEVTEVIIVYTDDATRLRYCNLCFEKAKEVKEITYCGQFDKWLHEKITIEEVNSLADLVRKA